MRRTDQIENVRLVRLGAGMLTALALTVASVGCQSMQDGARQVSLGAKDLGHRMSNAFRGSSSPSSPSFGSRAPSDENEQDPFLPPPKRPDAEETSSMPPRRLGSVTLGEPMDLPQTSMKLVSDPGATR